MLITKVTATCLKFVQQPSNATNGSTMTPAVTVVGLDNNKVTDLDQATSVSVACSTPSALSGNPVSATPSSGIATFGSLTHTIDDTYTLSASAAGLRDTVSTSYIISSTPSGTYRTTSKGTWPTGGTATWERFNGSTWASATPAANATDLLIIRDSITSRTSFAAPSPYTSMTIENGGVFIAKHNSTFKSILVKNGGVFIVEDPSVDIDAAGTLTVDSGGTVILNSGTLNHVDGFFQGTENFKKGSTLEVQNWDYDSSPGEDDLIDSYSSTQISTNADGYYFGKLFINLKVGITSKAFIIVGVIGNHKLCQDSLIVANNSASTKSVILSNVGSNVEIGGNVLVKAYKFSFGSLTSSTSTHTINGNLTIDGSTAIADINEVTSSAGVVVVNLKGDLIGLNGTYLCTDNTDAPASSLHFVNPIDSQNVDIVSSVTLNKFNMFVDSAAMVKLRNNNLTLNNTSSFTVKSRGAFNFNWNNSGTPLLVTQPVSPTGTNTFTTQPRSILKITSLDGITTTTGVGNVQVTAGNRTYDQVATFWYIGKANQVTGNGITRGASAKIIICDLVDNNTQLTFSDSTGITSTTTISPTGGKLDIRRGKVIETTTAYIYGSTGTLYMAPGTLYKITKGYAGVTDETGFSGGIFIPRMLGATYPYVLNGGTIELAGDSTTGNGFQTLRGTLGGRPNYKYVKFSSNNYYHTPTKTPSNYKNLSSATTVDSAVIVTDNAIVDCIGAAGSAQSFTGNGALVMSANSRIRFKNTSNTQPELDGNNLDYSLTGGTVEFYGTSSIQQQQLRGNFRTLPSTPVKINYYNIDINAAAANLQTFTSTPNSTQLGSVGNVDVNSSFLLTGALNVNAPAVLRMDQTDFIDNGTGSSQVVNINSGAGLLYANANGIKTSGTGINDGNIRTSGTRTFSTSANYGFVSSGDMASGNGLPTTVAGLYIYKTFKSNKVTLNNGGTLVNGILGLQKGTIISSDAQKVTLAVVATSDIKSPANVGGVQDMGYDSSYIEGKMGHNSTSTSSMIFPIGSTSIYGPIALTPQGTTTQTYSCEYTSNGYGTYTLDPANSPQLDHVSKVEWWNVTSTASGSNDDAKVKLFWRAHSQVSPLNTDWSNLRVAHFDATDWNTEGNSPTITGSVTTWGSVESDIYVPNFSPVTLSTITANNPLPVEITKFIGSCNGDYVQLDWTTASEKDSKLFIIERSTDGIHFENIGNVNAAGFSNTIKNYTFIDSSSSTDNYYRLVELDIDNAQQTSVIIKVSCDGVNGTNIFYTPTNGVEVEVYSTTTKELLFNVYEVSGRLLHQEIKQITQGYNKFSLELKRKLANGIYLIQQIDGSKSTATKVWVH